jgi:hypothetical protein
VGAGLFNLSASFEAIGEPAPTSSTRMVQDFSLPLFRLKLLMNDIFLITSDNWLDWITVFGYLGFTAFIAWRVVKTK